MTVFLSYYFRMVWFPVYTKGDRLIRGGGGGGGGLESFIVTDRFQHELGQKIYHVICKYFYKLVKYRYVHVHKVYIMLMDV